MNQNETSEVVDEVPEGDTHYLSIQVNIFMPIEGGEPIPTRPPYPSPHYLYPDDVVEKMIEACNEWDEKYATPTYDEFVEVMQNNFNNVDWELKGMEAFAE